MENKVLLSDIILNWLEYRKALQSGEDVEEKSKLYDQLFATVEIRNYLPLLEKRVALTQIIWHTFLGSDDKDCVDMQERFDMSLLIDGLLSYTNITNDLYDNALLIAIGDTLYESGYIDKILTYCEKDYQRLTKMAEHAVNFKDLFLLLDLFEKFDSQQFKQSTQEMKEALGGLTPEMIESISAMAKLNDPITTATVELLNKFGVLGKRDTLDEILKTVKETTES